MRDEDLNLIKSLDYIPVGLGNITSKGFEEIIIKLIFQEKSILW